MKLRGAPPAGEIAVSYVTDPNGVMVGYPTGPTIPGDVYWSGGTPAAEGLVKSDGSKLEAAVSGADFMRAHWVNVLDHGADPTGVSDSTAAFTAALAALPSAGGCVYAPSGTYKISNTLTFLPNQTLKGDGQNLTVISYTGTGPCLTTSNPTGPNGLQTYYWAFEDLSVDGTNAGTGAMGLRLTNVFNLIVRAFQVRYFQTAGAIGIGYVSGLEPGFQGYQMWTFDAVNLLYNTLGLDFDGGNGSYSQFDIYIQANSDQSGVKSHNVVKNYLNRFRLRGFFGATAATNSGYIFAIDPGDSSGTSCWESCSWDIITQPYPAVPTYPSHQTLIMGSSANILSGPGALEFFVYGFTTGNANGASVASGAQLAVPYLSDPVLGRAVIGYDALAVEGSSQWKVHGSDATTLASALHTGSNFRIVDADIQEFLLTNGNTTIGSFQFGSPTNVNLAPPFARARKVELLFHQPASGSPGTITWPSNVKWSSGNGTLSTANGAIDRVRFTYMPSTDTWYGEIDRNYTSATSGAGLPSGGIFLPSDYGLTSWAFDPILGPLANVAPVAGQAYFSLVPIRQAGLITNLVLQVAVAGASLTSGQCFAGLFDHSGNLLATTADQSTNWQSAGKQVMALDTPQVVAPGYYYVGLFVNGSTMPKIYSASVDAAGGIGASIPLTGTPRFVIDSTHTGLTTAFPSTATLTASGALAFWAAVS